MCCQLSEQRYDRNATLINLLASLCQYHLFVSSNLRSLELDIVQLLMGDDFFSKSDQSMEVVN